MCKVSRMGFVYLNKLSKQFDIYTQQKSVNM